MIGPTKNELRNSRSSTRIFHVTSSVGFVVVVLVWFVCFKDLFIFIGNRVTEREG